ncbi:decarboxylase UbiD (plasmid) [Burkholderia sp. SFA1]|uniref:UbiD family decarboxylase n=1 Tax=unclassified Caballeronia TaxID=2646786 RepID=UPI001F1DC5B4|nr:MULTISPECIES: UbiD family decarboxylase [unclassified Caballeronia]MCE4546994.1 UbiD family decarboxylase [Caballeronia sp. PC1]MCE4572533.1 UbiD family decarboxylase [Caballeronia sp. CLC5]BBQ02094.1 decarboxylase UbiD [Burkholderia sp. SFA1]
MADNLLRATQDFHRFADIYRERYPDDVLTLRDSVSADQDVTAIVAQLAARGQHPMLVCEHVDGISTHLATNFFASRERIARLFDTNASGLFDAYQQRANAPIAPVHVSSGPVLDEVIEGDCVDLAQLPMIRHFDTDRGPYVTNAVIVAEDPVTGIANLSYHRSMRHARNALATSLHSRGHAWRMLQTAKSRGGTLKVAMVIGAHPLFMLAAAARVPFGMDERAIAGGLFGAPLELVRTPRHGIGVPAAAEFVLEGTIDPDEHAEEGPFGEFTGYSSDRSTNNVLRVDTMMRRRDAWLVDVVGGPYAEHLTLARLPREAEMSEKLKARFPSVTALHYPNSGTHFHCYVALNQTRDGEARQIMLALLGWDPYLKHVVAVDSDIDIGDDSQVLWAMATHAQPHEDVFIVDGLPGSPLDPSSSANGTTSRMGIDATRGAKFDGMRARIGDEAMRRAMDIIKGAGR